MEMLIVAFLLIPDRLFGQAGVALLTARRSRLATLSRGGDTLAAAAVKLGAEPTRFLSTIQIGITSIGLLNGIVSEAVVAEPLADWLQSLGMEDKLSSSLATGFVVIAVTYITIVAGEIVPKRLGQHDAEEIARLVAVPMRALAWIAAPFVHLLSASTNALLHLLLKLMRIQPQDSGPQPLSPEEIRTIVLESSNYLPKKHVSILLNLFDLQEITVDDVMVPRNHLEAIDIDAPLEHIRQQVATAHHRRLLVYQGDLDQVLGMLRVRSVLNLVQNEELTRAKLLELVQKPYFVPARTPLFSQLQNFQEQKDRTSLVVDEYGELLGLVTLEDILEEIVGEFTTQSPLQSGGYTRQADGSYLVEGATPLRELNRKLGFNFPLDGPKTLNGLILEHLQDIPAPGTSLKIAGQQLDIVQTQDRVVKAVRVPPPAAPAARATGAPGAAP